MEESDTGGRFCLLCFSLVWIVISGAGTYMTLSTGSSPIFILIALGIGAIGVMMFIGALTGKMQGSRFHRGSLRPVVITEPAQTRTSSAVYVPPSNCPNCGAPLSDETVEWVGPLQLKCASCGHTVDARKRVL